ncbi:MAG TPA: ketopantoate reductase family protein [Acetobacteraceae bacterium]|nr:ketopantoate reductase family protein [Acetobacteraceae bacterium]
MRLLVVGAGATGGYFGGRLLQAGRDVTFLVRPRRAEQLRESGLQIVSPYGDATLKPKLVTAGEIAGPYDAALVTVKAFALEPALADFAPAVGPETMILPVLNGMRHVDVLTARFGARALVGCVCKVATTLDEAGRIIQLAKFQELAYGEMNGAASPRTESLDHFMRGAGFDARLTPTVLREMWEKWVLLAAMGGATCLMRGNVGQIEAAPGGTSFVTALIDEVVSVVEAVGEKPSADHLAIVGAMMTAKGSGQASSMYRDLQQGNPIEGDHIVGDLLARGQRAGIATPLLAAAYANLAIYQRRISAS